MHFVEDEKEENGRGRGRGMPSQLHGRLTIEAHSAETLMTENISLRQQIEHIEQVDNAEFDKLYTVIGSKQTGIPKPQNPLLLHWLLLTISTGLCSPCTCRLLWGCPKGELR